MIEDKFSLKPVIEPIEYSSGVIKLLDQRCLPCEEKWLEIDELSSFVDAVRSLAVRGAPLLGIAAGYGILVGLYENLKKGSPLTTDIYNKVKTTVAATRPTARNLFDTIERIGRVYKKKVGSNQDEIIAAIEVEARRIHEKERSNCIAIAKCGAGLLHGRVITHCNTGVLATGGIGTAFGAIHAAFVSGMLKSVWVDETRPLLQGARLTAWELGRIGIPYKIICDSAAASLISCGMVDVAITGADRIAANGDSANKIGTLGLATICNRYDVPFYIAAPTSTFDRTIRSGEEIVVEQRPESEIVGWGKCRWAPEDASAENPAFDVTPASSIAAIITEKGIIEWPNTDKIAALLD